MAARTIVYLYNRLPSSVCNVNWYFTLKTIVGTDSKNSIGNIIGSYKTTDFVFNN